MSKYTDDTNWKTYDAEPEDDEEIIWVSKSEIKRDAETLKKLGAELLELSKSSLEKIPLDDDLQAAIRLGQKLKWEARRRQIQLIGKLLRSRDPEPIYAALDKLKNRHNQQTALLHKLEKMRDELLEQGDPAIQNILNNYPNGDRQQLRSLIRQTQKEQQDNKPPKAFRQLFQYLKELADTDA